MMYNKDPDGARALAWNRHAIGVIHTIISRLFNHMYYGLGSSARRRSRHYKKKCAVAPTATIAAATAPAVIPGLAMTHAQAGAIKAHSAVGSPM